MSTSRDAGSRSDTGPGALPTIPRQRRAIAEPETIRDVIPGDAELVRRVANGDRDAFAALYDRYGARVFALTRRLLHDASLAEDASQDVFLTVWRRASQFDPTRGSVRSWVMTLAHGRAVDAVRREQSWRDRTARFEQLAAPPRIDCMAEAVRERAVDRAVQASVSDALSVLTGLQRSAIELAYFGELTYRQVAEVLDIPVATAKSRIRAGLLRMAAAAQPAPPVNQ